MLQIKCFRSQVSVLKIYDQSDPSIWKKNMPISNALIIINYY